MIPNISDKYKCIFIHIPKTAGTSIESKLGFYSDNGIRGQQDHRTISQIKEEISSKKFNDYFKFTFVRNPWARAYSWYKNVLNDKNHKENLGIYSNNYSFKKFLSNHLHNWALKTQMSWIKDEKGKIAVDFIGKYENLNEDFAKICENLKIENKELLHLIRGKGSNYIEAYDEKLKKIVAKKYAEEIEYFGYKFGD